LVCVVPKDIFRDTPAIPKIQRLIPLQQGVPRAHEKKAEILWFQRLAIGRQNQDVII
jgi:hypothetical protein